MVRATESFLVYATFIITMSNIGMTEITAIRICGRNLAEALAVVCDTRGYNMAYRSGPSPSKITGSSITSAVETTPDRRHRRGIVEECCHNWCPLATLESYCREDESVTSKPALHISKRSYFSKAFFSKREKPVFPAVVKDLSYNHDWSSSTNKNSENNISDEMPSQIKKIFGYSDQDQISKKRFFYPLQKNHVFKHKTTKSI